MRSGDKKLEKLSFIGQVLTVWVDYYGSCGLAFRTGDVSSGSEFHFHMWIDHCLFVYSISYLP